MRKLIRSLKGESVLYLLVSTAARKMLVVLPTQLVIKCIPSSFLSVSQSTVSTKAQRDREKLFSFEQMESKTSFTSTLHLQSWQAHKKKNDIKDQQCFYKKTRRVTCWYFPFNTQTPSQLSYIKKQCIHRFCRSLFKEYYWIQ